MCLGGKFYIVVENSVYFVETEAVLSNLLDNYGVGT
jgi:hypothetical protein